MLNFFTVAVDSHRIEGETMLLIFLGSCPRQCAECVSEKFKEESENQLSISILHALIENNPDITCIGFVGGDNDHNNINFLANYIHLNTNLKVCMYSSEKIDKKLVNCLDYYVIYFCDLTSNKRKYYKIIDNELIEM